MNFKEYLTPEERLGCWQAGFMRKLAAAGKVPSDVAPAGVTTKEAGFGSSMVKGVELMWNALGDSVIGALGLGLAAGLPIGTVLHVADRNLKSDRKKTKELMAQRDAYRDAIAKLKNSLMSSGGELAV